MPGPLGSEGIADGGLPGSGSTVISGGYELANGVDPAADNDFGATASGVLFSGGGMMHLDALLSEFAGVISGFDLGDEIAVQSLGFGSSSGAMTWMQQTSGGDAPPSVDGGGHIFGLTLLGQYAANFSAAAHDHGGSLIIDPSLTPASSSLPLIAPSNG